MVSSESDAPATGIMTTIKRPIKLFRIVTGLKNDF